MARFRSTLKLLVLLLLLFVASVLFIGWPGSKTLSWPFGHTNKQRTQAKATPGKQNREQCFRRSFAGVLQPFHSTLLL